MGEGTQVPGKGGHPTRGALWGWGGPGGVGESGTEGPAGERIEAKHLVQVGALPRLLLLLLFVVIIISSTAALSAVESLA